MRRVSMDTRDELLSALGARYGEAGRAGKGRILTEFVMVTGYHRKHAARLLRRAIFTASGHAQRAATYLHELAHRRSSGRWLTDHAPGRTALHSAVDDWGVPDRPGTRGGIFLD